MFNDNTVFNGILANGNNGRSQTEWVSAAVLPYGQLTNREPCWTAAQHFVHVVHSVPAANKCVARGTAASKQLA
jgi:hypothetical protein